MALTHLLPVRHPQGDFFIADIFDNLPFKGDMAGMEHPMFTLQVSKPDMRVMRYENGGAAVEMNPSNIGLPTIMDKDILLYCASVVMHKINAGEIPPQTIRFSLRDVLLTTNRVTSNHGYNSLKNALHRMAGCLLKTSIKTGGTYQETGFHLIESYKYLESTRVKDRQIGVELTLSDWFYNSLIGLEVLTIDREYFQLRKPLDRRLYEIARKHCGYRDKPWTIRLDRLLLKTGSRVSEVKFRWLIRQLEQSNHIPDFTFRHEAVKDMVTVRYKKRRLLGKGAGAAPAELPSPKVLGELSASLLDDARRVVGKHYDFYGLWGEYKAWDGSTTATNIRGAFIGFCRQKVGLPPPKTGTLEPRSTKTEEQPDLFDD